MILRKIAVIALGIAVACNPAFSVAYAQPYSTDDRPRPLEAGSFVEHEALAYIVESESRDGSNLSSRGSAQDLLASSETLMTVDGEAAGMALEGDGHSASAFGLDSRSGEIPDGRIVLVRDESCSTEELIARLESDPCVAFVEPNYIWDAPESPQPFSGDMSSEGTGDMPSGMESVPDMSAYQWAANNTGAFAGVSKDGSIDIDYDVWENAAEEGNWAEAASAACSAMASEDPVVVAVVDTGVDARNPDLAPVMWDEGLSIPELVERGGDAHGLSTFSDPGLTSTSGMGPNEAHGTHVAGIIAAAWDGAGVSGVAPNAEIMSVRLDFSISNALKAFDYIAAAADAGVNVRVANCSWTLGATASRMLEIGINKMGDRGVVSLFASGNSNSDMDRSLDMSTLLRDNPYVIAVNSIDPSGEKSVFSNYGAANTDVMAPGGVILSSYNVDQPSYMGEGDADAVLYESFDEKTNAASGAGLESGSPQLEFFYEGTADEVPVIEGGMRFDGDAALAVDYDADAPEIPGSITNQTAELADYQMIVSKPIDLSAVENKPCCMSIRYASAGSSSQPDVWLAVKPVDSDEMVILGGASGGFGATQSAWCGGYFLLPEDTDFENFQIGLIYCSKEVSLIGGVSSVESKDDTVFIDSIGFGDGSIPYAYLQGTSMASPVAAGVTAVAAGAYPDDSAEKLAARVKGGVRTDERYSDLCATGGLVTVSGMDDPAPTPVKAVVSDDGRTMTLRGYFIGEDVSASIDGISCAVLDRTAIPGTDGLVELAIEVPQGFEGGEAWTVLQSGGSSGRMLVDFGTRADLSYYEDDLPVPSELEAWSDWQLVGFAGDLYALPREGAVNAASESHPFFMKYDTASQEWSRVSFPLDELADLGVLTVTSASATTYRGSLVMQITGSDAEAGSKGALSGTYWKYDSTGAWEHIPVALPPDCELALSGMATDGDRLFAFGGYGVFDEEPLQGLSMMQGTVGSIVEIDVDEGIAETVGFMGTRRYNAHVAYRDGSFIVAGGQGDVAQSGSMMGVTRLAPLPEAVTRPSLDLPWFEVTYPAGWIEGVKVDTSGVVDETGRTAWACAAVSDGFMLIGPRGNSGATDTYSLSNASGSSLQEYALNASHSALMNPAAVAYDGKLYVIAAVPGSPSRIFAATSIETVAQPGDCLDPDNPGTDGGDGPDAGDGQGGESGEDQDSASGDASKLPGTESGQEDGDDSASRFAATGDSSGVIAMGAAVAAIASGALLLIAARRLG